MKTEYDGNLIITRENQDKFKELTEVSGYISVRENTKLDAPKLEKSGYIVVCENAKLNMPELTEVTGYITVNENATLDAPKLTEVTGSISVYENAKLNVPKLEKSGYIVVWENAKLDMPKLTEVTSNIVVYANAKLNMPKLTEVTGSISVWENATLNMPKLTEVSGDIYVYENATLDAPKLEKSGYISVWENATLNMPELTIRNNKADIENEKYDIVFNDGIPFFVKHSKSSKGIKIHAGILAISYCDSKIITKEGYLVEKEGFSAHAETLNKAIIDLKFKIASEKIKKEPISPDTIITVEKYRIITGSCDIGCREFLEKYNIPFHVKNKGKNIEETVVEKEFTAKELLPLLEKENAYGLEKFNKLIDF